MPGRRGRGPGPRRGPVGPARPAARRQVRRTVRRRRRRRRILVGGMVVLAGGAVAYKLSKKDAQRIEQHTGTSPEELSEEELTTAMNQLGIENQPLTAEDTAAIGDNESGEEYYDDAPATEPDYLDELERLAGLRDKGVITEEDFQAKKKQLLGL